MRSVRELETRLRGAEVWLEETEVDQRREDYKIEICCHVDQAEPGIDLH